MQVSTLFVPSSGQSDLTLNFSIHKISPMTNMYFQALTNIYSLNVRDPQKQKYICLVDPVQNTFHKIILNTNNINIIMHLYFVILQEQVFLALCKYLLPKHDFE